MIRTSTLLAAAACFALALPGAAQKIPFLGGGPRVWLEFGHDDSGSAVSLDSASVRSIGASRFEVVTQIRYPEALTAAGGARYDRQLEYQELSCREYRIRSISVALLVGDSTVQSRSLDEAPRPVRDAEASNFRSRCDVLDRLARAARRAAVVESTEERPALRNAAEIGSLARRIYEELRASGVGEGRLVLSFVIDEHGRPELATLELISSELPTGADIARRMVAAMRFRPARINGRPVKVRIQVPVRIAPSQSQPQPDGGDRSPS
jgi:hypothetical protein